MKPQFVYVGISQPSSSLHTSLSLQLYNSLSLAGSPVVVVVCGAVVAQVVTVYYKTAKRRE